MRRTAIFGVSAIVALVLLSLVVFHDAVVVAAIRGVAGSFGYNVAFARLQTGWSTAAATGTNITNRAGEPVFAASRIEVQYSLRDLLPGSRHRFGLTALDVERPKLVLIHHPDGTYNVTLPAGSTTPAKPDTTPIDVRARVRDGSVLLVDRFVQPGVERRQRIVGLALDANLSPVGHAFYDAHFDLDDGHTRYPVAGKATFASTRGFDAQRWSAAVLPIGPLVNFALPSHAINVVDGRLRGLDARIYTFVDAAGATDTHVSARAQLEDGKIYVAALAKPLRDVRGPILAYGNGVTTTGIDATLAGVPLHLAGGVYLAKTPQVRFALRGGGALAALRTITIGGQHQPVTGDLAFAFRAIGDAASPLVMGTFSAPSVGYGAYRVDRVRGDIALQGTHLDILGTSLAYGPLQFAARGSLDLQRDVGTDLIAQISGDGDRLPYVGQLVRGLRVNAVAHVSGTGARLATQGIAFGNGSDGSLNALFNLDGDGNGVIGPIAIDRNDGASFYARMAIDRRHGSVSAIADARHFSLLAPVAARTALPGIDLAALPPVAGTLDAALAGSVDSGRLTAASGHLRLVGLRAGAITGSATADIAGAADGTQHALLRVRSNVADIDGNGTYDGGWFAFAGRVRSSFDRLQPLVPTGAHGAVDVPLRALSDGTTVAAQIAGARFGGARVHGIAVDGVDATVTSRNGTTTVRAARIGVDGGDVIAEGRVGDDSDVVVTTSALALRPFATAALPIASGTVLAHVRARGSLRDPRADIGVLVDGARVRGIALGANATATYATGTLHVNDATALAADAYATASGEVRGLTGGAPTVDLTATVHGAQVAAIDRIFPLPLRYPDGEIDADVHATGRANAPQIAADVRIPNGSINGLAFRDARIAASGDLTRLAVRGGTVSVGTTTVTFDGDLGRAVQRIAVRAPHVDLADFDDYFNTADTLSGRGHLALAATVTTSRVQSHGDLRIDDARFRRFPIGTTAATWNTTGRTLHAKARIAGTHGTASASAAATFPATAPLRDAAHRVTLDATGQLAALDLATWLPAAGITAPVAGIVDGSAHVTGAPATPSFALGAAVTNGIAAGYHLDAFTLAASGDRRSARLTGLHVAGPGLVADASGTAGYGSHDPIAFALHAQSDDLPTLERAAGLKLVVGGSIATDVHVSGTRGAPRLAQTIDAQHLTYGTYTLARVHGDAVADARTLRVNTLEADFAKGRLLATATVPIALAPPSVGLRDAPLSASLQADGIDLAQFEANLPAKTTLAGTLEGRVLASGSVHDPAIDGTLTLAGGTYASSLVRSPFTNARARVTFTRNTAQLSDVHADVGGGAIDGSGTARFGDVRDLRHTLALDAQLTAANAGLAIDPYLTRSKVNGTVTATKTTAQRDVVIGGTVAFAQTRVPATALLPASTPKTEKTPAPLPIAFNLNVQAGNDVRVQGAGVNVGARGAIAVGGTLAAPTLAGRLTSTDGSLSFYRTFVLQQGTVAFDPADGIIPTVDATATTSISNPTTDILLHVTGPATNLNLDFASNPSYSKEQILGLLVNAQAIGAVSGVQTAQNTGGSGFNATNLAGGYLSSELTQNLLQPFGSQLGSSLGLSDLALGYDYGSGFSAGATRALGKNLSATFHQTFGIVQREIIGVNYALRDNASLQFSFFNAGNQSPNIVASGNFLGNQDPFTPANYTLQALQPPPGVAGTVFTYQRKFWTGPHD